MRLIRTITLAALTTGPLAAGTAPPAVMRFANDDRISGHLQSITLDGLTWASPALAEAASFPMDKILDLTLPADNRQPETSHTATLTLKNGDIIRGELGAVSEDTITLDTWFAGRLMLNRPMVSSIRIETRQTHHYVGPNSIEDWTHSDKRSPAWKYENRAFISTGQGGIARDNTLPPECSVAFDVEWKPDMINLKLILFSQKPDDTRPESGYELAFQSSSVYLRSGGRNANFIGSGRCRDLRDDNKAHIEVRASNRTGKIALFINGDMIESWNDPEHESGSYGSCLHFLSTSSAPKMRISNIQVSPWDGKIEQTPSPQMQDDNAPTMRETPAESDHTRMLLANGDSLNGEITAIHDGIVAVATSLGDMKIPIDRFRTLQLPGLDRERAIRRKGDIRAHFPDGSSLVFRLDSTDGSSITGSSQNFGTASFQLASIRHIEFNLYDPEISELRKKRDW